ncbi:PrpF domain-containing protein [Pandoraea pneumonica]|uniref:PrpF domain-containing protein n=1 Tax=Pandoraea pneumonica TaxID=2508299 RepID=UPI003CE6D0B3
MRHTITPISASYVRGGTSRAVIFRWDDLPSDQTKWKSIFQSVLGSPDLGSKQLDGLGGGITSLSKVAVVRRSSRPGVDVDYYFVQVEPSTGEMLVDANCGNISSAIGPFAVDEGWVHPETGGARVRIFNENSGKIIESRFNPAADESEFIEIDGVAGKAMPITLSFEDPSSSMGRGFLPTGNIVDTLDVAGKKLEVTLLDVAVPCAIVAASSVGINGDDSYTALVANRDYVDLMRELRVAASLRMGFCSDAREARDVLVNVPDIVVVSPAPLGRAGITARFVSCDLPHRAAPVTSSMALATACLSPGTVAAEFTGINDTSVVTIHHQSGELSIGVRLHPDGRPLSTEIQRTARRIMQGQVLVPFSMP